MLDTHTRPTSTAETAPRGPGGGAHARRARLGCPRWHPSAAEASGADDSATVGREFQYAPADSDGVTRTQPAGPGRPDGAGTRRVDPTGRGPAGSARPDE